jgi:hypothetical protein
MYIYHLMFVDDILYFSHGSHQDLEVLKGILDLYSKATSMQINEGKSCLLSNNFPAPISQAMSNLFHFPHKVLDDGFKYLSFNLKPDNYCFVNWF